MTHFTDASMSLAVSRSVNYANIGSDNVLSPCRHQAIIWSNAGILLIGHLGTNISEIAIETHAF